MTMKLRVSVEDRAYDVEVDILNHGSDGAGPGPALAEAAVSELVVRPRPPQRLPEDCVVRSPIAGRVVAILAAPAQEIRRHEGVVLLDAMKMEVPIGPRPDRSCSRWRHKGGTAFGRAAPTISSVPPPHWGPKRSAEPAVR